MTAKQHTRGPVRQLAILLLCLAWGATAGRAQENRVILPTRHLTVAEAMAQIELQTGLSVAHGALANLNWARNLNLSKTEGTVGELLPRILAGTGVTHEMQGNYIVLREAPAPAPVEAAPEAAAPDTTPERVQGVRIAPLTHRVVHPRAVEPVPAPVGNYPTAGNLRQTPHVALKTNLLMDATASISLGAEVRTGGRTTLDIPFSYNGWNMGDNRKWKHILVQPELRYWMCEPFSGHFFGLHAHYAYYNVGHLYAPPFSEAMNRYRYNGWLAGAGVSYGYHWIVGKRLSIEATVGVGFAYLDYAKYPCEQCGRKIGDETKFYVGPTRAAISLIIPFK